MIFSILFNYINELLHDLQNDNIESGTYYFRSPENRPKVKSRLLNKTLGTYMNAALILYLFYFIHFAFSTVIVVANRALVVAAFNKHVLATSDQVCLFDIQLTLKIRHASNSWDMS